MWMQFLSQNISVPQCTRMMFSDQSWLQVTETMEDRSTEKGIHPEAALPSLIHCFSPTALPLRCVFRWLQGIEFQLHRALTSWLLCGTSACSGVCSEGPSPLLSFFCFLILYWAQSLGTELHPQPFLKNLLFWNRISLSLFYPAQARVEFRILLPQPMATDPIFSIPHISYNTRRGIHKWDVLYTFSMTSLNPRKCHFPFHRSRGYMKRGGSDHKSVESIKFGRFLKKI